MQKQIVWLEGVLLGRFPSEGEIEKGRFCLCCFSSKLYKRIFFKGRCFYSRFTLSEVLLLRLGKDSFENNK